MLFLFFMFQPAERLPFPLQPDIQLEIIESAGYRGRVCFFAPHETEAVINDDLRARVVERGGRFVILHQYGERNIAFKLGDAEIYVDPNRIFTRRGCRASVANENPDLAQDTPAYKQACHLAESLGRFVLDHLVPVSRKTVFVAVHNNTDGYDDDGKGGIGTVSIQRYNLKLKKGARYIKKLHIGPGDEDDLFFVTRRKDFKAMKRAGWNVVLQHRRVARLAAEDDGSLSVYAEMVGCRYINIEAQRRLDESQDETLDHLDIQRQMLDFVYDLLIIPAPQAGTGHPHGDPEYP